MSMHSTRFLALFSAAFCSFSLVAVGCSSSSSGGGAATGGDASSSADGTSGDAHDGSHNCVPPGTPNNEQGVGGYCEQASDCPGAFCSALFGAPPDDWFCTKICANGEPCGSGETCATDPQKGTACVPTVCIGDAGTGDSGSADAGTD